MKHWKSYISQKDQDIYRTAGFGRPSGIGSRPALLIIDVQYRTAGTQRVGIEKAMAEFPTACGKVAWNAIDQITPLLKLFRTRGWPVLYPYVSPKEPFDVGRVTDKVPTMMGISEKGYQFVREIAPQKGEILLPKKHPSAFFGTPLASYLVNLGIDTLVVTGCATSGCIRGTVVDAFSYNYRVTIPEECVYDRGQISHAVNLFDMASKYADVSPVGQCIKLLKKISDPPS